MFRPDEGGDEWRDCSLSTLIGSVRPGDPAIAGQLLRSLAVQTRNYREFARRGFRAGSCRHAEDPHGGLSGRG